jgi:acyl carrier protein
MSTLETLQDILIDEFDLTRERVAPDAELTALGVDSLDLLELMFKIEDRYKLSIRDDVPNDLTTVCDVVRFIDRLLAAQSKSPGTGGADRHAAT